MKLLLVDDEPEICLLLKAMLEREGVDCSMAHSLKEAERFIEQARFQGAIVDINLPDGKGTTLIGRLKRGSPDMRVIAISAVDREADAALAAGADRFLSKPLSRQAIFEGLDLKRPPGASNDAG